MKLRKDAAAAVAEAMVWIERHCGGGPRAEGARLGAGEGQEPAAAAEEGPGMPAADAEEEGGEDGAEAGRSPTQAVDAEEGGESLGEGGDDSLVCTTGAVSLWPGASNVIAGAANFSVDVRCTARPAAARRRVPRTC